MIRAVRLARPGWWPGVAAWMLWALVMVVCLVVPWLDQPLRQAGRPDLVQWDARPGVAAVSAATIGAVLILLGFVLLLTPTGSLPRPAGAGGPGPWWPCRWGCWRW